MSYHSLHDLFISLPDHIKVYAVNEYIHELGKSGNLAEASKFFERLCTLTGHDTEKAHAAWYVIGLYLKQRQFEHAHSIYTILAKLEQTAAVEDIRAKAARIIIYSLLPETPSRALQVWLSLADGQLPVGITYRKFRTI